MSNSSPINDRFIVSSYPNLITARSLEGIEEDFESEELDFKRVGAVLFNPVPHEWSIIIKLEFLKNHGKEGMEITNNPFLYTISYY